MFSFVSKPSAVSLSLDVLSSAMSRNVWERASRLFMTADMALVRTVHLVGHSWWRACASVKSAAMLWYCAIRLGDALM